MVTSYLAENSYEFLVLSLVYENISLLALFMVDYIDKTYFKNLQVKR